MTIGEYRDILKKHVSQKRYTHSLEVAKQAVRLANQFGADPEKAEIAGLLHDICKEMPEEKQLQYLKQHAILLDVKVVEYPWIWHGFTASVYLKEELGITDEDILNAVKLHTTGRANMTLLEEIIFVADATSDDRDYPDMNHVRDCINQGLEYAVFEKFKFAILNNINHGRLLLDDNTEGYNYYLKKL